MKEDEESDEESELESDTEKSQGTYPWVKVFRINPELRILRLTFHSKSALKS